MLVGSVSLACALHAACSVTVVHSAAEAEREEPDRARAVPATT
jgi:hypothetical protein